MPVDLGSLTARIGLDSTPLIAGAAAARGELSGLESSGVSSLQRLSDIGRTAFLALGASAAVIGVASLKAASDFQASMELVRTQAGASQGEVDSMTSAILRMASSVGTAPEQLAQALFHIESAGYRGAQALDILRIAAEGAKVGQADLEDVTNALIAVEVSHIKGVSSVSDAMGVLNAIVGVGNVRMGDLAAAMGTGILSSAAAFGLSLQDVGGAMAVLTDNAVPADEAATRLRMTFSLMAAPTQAAQKALASIGITQFQLAEDMRTGGLIKAIGDLRQHLIDSGLTATEQAAVLTQAFGGGRTSAAILTLVEQFDRLKQKIGDVGAGSGTFQASWEATKETFKFQMDEMKAAVDVLAIRIGTVLIPIVTKMAVAVADAVKWLTQHKDVALALAAAIGGPLLVAMTAFVAEEVIALAPILAVGAALAALSGGFVYAYEKIGPFHDAIDAVGKFLQSTFLAAVNGAKQAWDGFITGFQNPEQKINVSGIQGVFQGLGANLRVVFADTKAGWDLFLLGFSNPNIDVSGPEGVIVGFGQTVKTVLSGLSGAWNSFVQYIRDIAPQAQEAVGHIAAVIKAQLDLVAGIFAVVFQAWSAAWRQWGDDLMRIVRPVFDSVKAIIETGIRVVRDIINTVLALINGDWGKAWNSLADIPRAGFDLIKTLVTDALKIIGNLFATGWDAISQAVPAAFGVMLTFFKNLPGQITGAMGSLAGVLATAGKDLINGLWTGVQNGWDAVLNFFKGLPDTIKTGIGDATKWLTTKGKDTVQGYIDGLVEKLTDIKNWFTDLPTKIKTWVGNALTWLKQTGRDTIQGLIDGLVEKLADIKNWFASLPGTIAGAVGNALTWLKQTGRDTVQGLIDGLVERLADIGNWFLGLPGKIQGWIGNALTWLKQTGLDTVQGFINGLGEVLPAVGNWFLGLPGKIQGWLGNALTWLKQHGKDTIQGYIDGLGEAVVAVFNWFKDLPGKITGAVSSALTWLKQHGRDTVQGYIDGMSEKLTDIFNWFKDLPGKITGAVGGALTWLKQHGRDTIQGFIDGMVEKLVDIKNWFADLPGKILGWVGNTLQWLKQHGRDTIQGFIDGLLEKAGDLFTWVRDELPKKIEAGMAGAPEWLKKWAPKIIGGLTDALANDPKLVAEIVVALGILMAAVALAIPLSATAIGVAIIAGIVTGIIQQLPVIHAALHNAGIDIIVGILDGMINALDLLPGVVQRFLGIDVILKGLKAGVDALKGAKIDITAQAETTQAQQALDDLLATMGGIVDYSHPPPGNQGPAFATGGMTHGPSLAGEAGPELVLPLSHLQRARQLLREQGGAITGAGGSGSMGSQSSVTQYILNGNIVASDPAELERQLEARARVAAMAGR